MQLAGGVQCSINNGVKQPAGYPVQIKNSNWDYDHIEQDVTASAASIIIFFSLITFCLKNIQLSERLIAVMLIIFTTASFIVS